MILKVHLVFPGICEDALTFYKDILKGEVDFLFRKKEEKGRVLEEKEKEKISHMVVKTPHFELAGEDADYDQKVIAGNNNKLVLVFQDLTDCRKVFDAFAEGGDISMPFEKTFFSEGMGEVTDKYGISWIIMMRDDDYST
ncbi:MAG: hypothetical protein E6772_06145 [Dysgonomonas sp.]|nr:hypothetical protein [Dysgonomonas sp.]